MRLGESNGDGGTAADRVFGSSPPPPPSRFNLTFLRTLLWTLSLGLLAFMVNHWPVTIFFDIQIMLGGSLAIFALLKFGWWALPVGAAAAALTLSLWGHPWATINPMLELIWLKVFLDHFNGGSAQRDNGRIVLASLAYWVLLGVGLETLLYVAFLGTDPANAWFLEIGRAHV